MSQAPGKSFWTTLPGIITASATLLTAIAGLIVVLHGQKPSETSPNQTSLDGRLPQAPASLPSRSEPMTQVTRASRQTATIPPQLPNVSGMFGLDAYKKLHDFGMLVREAREPSETIRPCQVIRSDPPPGTSLVLGQKVTIVVSSGPASTNIHYACPPVPADW